MTGDGGRTLGSGAWYDAGTRELRGSACGACRTPSFPPRAFCWRCGGPSLPQALPRTGVLAALTRVRVAPAGYPDQYAVGVVRLLPDLHVLARVEDSAAERGLAVEVRTGLIRHDADGPVYGPVFGPAPTGLSPPPQEGPGHAATRRPPPALRPAAAVAVVGVATTTFGRPDLPAEQLAGDAALAAVSDAGLSPHDVDAVVVGSAFSTAALGQKMLRHVPWGGRRLLNVENACASGTTALAEAVALVRAGLADVVVAVGADTPVRSGGGLIPLDQEDPVAGIGVTLPALYALIGDRHAQRYRVGPDAFAEVVVRSRENAGRNPDAYRRSPVTCEEVLASRPIADPVTLFQCSPNADGAAAVVVQAARGRAGRAHPPVELAALGLSTGLTKDRFTGDSIVERVSRAVYSHAGVHPSDVGVVELHDAFAPSALTNLEGLGLAEPGTAAARLLAGGFRGGSSGPLLNPSGGLLSRGHPPGATGLAQVAELVRQLRGEAGDRQVPDPGVALLQTMGGTVLELETNACTVGILKRAD